MVNLSCEDDENEFILSCPDDEIWTFFCAEQETNGKICGVVIELNHGNIFESGKWKFSQPYIRFVC